MPSNRDYDSQGDGGFDGFFDDHHQYYDTYAGRQHRDRAPPAQHNPNTSTNTDLSASQVRRQQSAGSNSVNGGGPYSEVSNTSMAGRPLMGIGATNTDYEAGPADSRSHLATEPTRRNTPHRKGDEGREEDLETGQPASSFWKGKRGRTLVRPERQPAPQPGDPHYHEYLLNAPEVTAPAGPRSRNHRRNVLTRGDNTALTAITNTQAFRNSQYNQNHGTSGRFAGKPKKYSCPGPWTLYSRIITFWAPPPILGLFGLKSPQMQQAWREKIALISVILFLCGCVAFMTFALQQVLCPKISGQSDRVRYSEINEDSVVINGYSYNISRYMHPASSETGDQPTLLVNQPDNKVNASFMDLSLMFQNPNANCKGILKYQKDFMNSDQNVGYIFPCQMVAIDTTSDKIDTGANFNTALCHNKQNQRNALAKLERKPVYYTWEDINRKGQYMSIYNGMVLDILRLNWLVEQVQMHPTMKKVLNGNYRGQDLTMFFASTDVKVGKCLQDIVSVGFIDTSAIGCIASSIVMYVSLIVILAVVFAKFFMAVYFGWFMSRRLGAIKPETPEERKQRLEQIEAWADKNTHFGERENLNPQYSVTQTPGHSKRLPWLPTISRYSQFNPGEDIATRRQGRRGRASLNPASVTSAHINSMYMHDNRSTASPIGTPNRHYSGTPAMDPSASAFDDSTRDLVQSSRQSQIVDFASYPVVEYDAVSHPRQPETETLWDFELAYTLLLVTCYSEGSHGIRTTLDSLAGTDYPSSHKCIFVICDGLIKGEGEDMYTPDVCLSMMKDFVIPPDRVQPYTYVAIASGAKRRNMAKIYAGFYAPNEDSPESAKKHPVPMVLVVKCGTPEESSDKKPGNRGKRDSQVVLMNFLQHVMFDDRMTELEYELFNAMWNVTGVTPDNFEIVLMVDADTKVYGDSVTRMIATMVNDPQIMGLCGETKIANKRDSWVSMIQVFEYYISHHQAKAFEAVFGGVTCLPGCFCMYRIKAPKGSRDYWVPILANPSIVENYSEYIVDTLHKKNLLLLGEDRYLTTLMLRTFPKRKMMFVPSAVCKTVVPDKFKILLSQRRRWINSTVHNLMELVLVKDLCGTFCLSMQFVIFMELVGTVVLPAAISFTLYIIVISTFTRPVPWLPLALLGAILGLPAVLIGLTTRKIVYVGWMIIYLFSLPIWNFVLPTYAFWHFDDFSWGETRKVQGEGKGGGHGDGDGEFDSTKIVMKRWCDFEAEKRRKTRAILHETPELMSAAIGLAGSQRHSMRKQSYSGMASPLTGPPSESSRHGLDSSTTDQGSLTSGGNNTDSAVLHQPTAVIQSDVAQLQAIAGDERRMSRAADNLEKLGYMTPHIIPALATGTPPRTSSTNLAGMNGNSQRMSVYSAHQYPFLQSSPGFQQQSMPPPPPPIPSMSLGGSSTGSQHQGSTINSMRRSISGQSVPSALEERRRTKY